MALSPLDIHNKEFNRKMRGYDVDEVNTFLNQVMKDYELKIKEIEDLTKQVDDLKSQVNHFSNMETTLNQSIVIAQETAEEVKVNARREAKLIIKESKKNADRIINDALNETRHAAMEMEGIRRQANIFRARLTMLIQSQLEIVNNEDWDLFEEKADSGDGSTYTQAANLSEVAQSHAAATDEHHVSEITASLDELVDEALSEIDKDISSSETDSMLSARLDTEPLTEEVHADGIVGAAHPYEEPTYDTTDTSSGLDEQVSEQDTYTNIDAYDEIPTYTERPYDAEQVSDDDEMETMESYDEAGTYREEGMYEESDVRVDTDATSLGDYESESLRTFSDSGSETIYQETTDYEQEDVYDEQLENAGQMYDDEGAYSQSSVEETEQPLNEQYNYDDQSFSSGQQVQEDVMDETDHSFDFEQPSPYTERDIQTDESFQTGDSISGTDDLSQREPSYDESNYQSSHFDSAEPSYDQHESLEQETTHESFASDGEALMYDDSGSFQREQSETQEESSTFSFDQPAEREEPSLQDSLYDDQSFNEDLDREEQRFDDSVTPTEHTEEQRDTFDLDSAFSDDAPSIQDQLYGHEQAEQGTGIDEETNPFEQQSPFAQQDVSSETQQGDITFNESYGQEEQSLQDQLYGHEEEYKQREASEEQDEFEQRDEKTDEERNFFFQSDSFQPKKSYRFREDKL